MRVDLWLRGARTAGRLVASRYRLLTLKALYPGITVRGKVFVGPRCDIQVLQGGRLLLDGCHVSAGTTIISGREATVEIRADLVGPRATIVARESITVGEGTLIAEHCVIRDANHDHSQPLALNLHTSAPVVIGNDVWLATGVVVLSGVTVGHGATVGAGAVVTRDVPSGATAVGVPARVRVRDA